MLERWIYGYTPPGFKRMRSGRCQVGILREDVQRYFSFEKLKAETASDQLASEFFGRGRLKYFHIDNGESVLVRTYRRGGLVRRLTKGLYFSWPPRPFKELAVTEEVRRRGIPTLEILGAGIEKSRGVFYRGWLVSRELTGACDLWTALRKELYVGIRKEMLLQNVAQSLKNMHRQGIYHGDLNLKNILVRQEDAKLGVYIIDFDKAKLFRRPLGGGKVNRNLTRLLRSVRKLDPEGRFFSPKDRTLFFGFYHDAV